MLQGNFVLRALFVKTALPSSAAQNLPSSTGLSWIQSNSIEGLMNHAFLHFFAACGSLLACFKTKPLGSIPVSSEHEYSALSTLSHDSHSKFNDEEPMMIDAFMYKKFVSNHKNVANAELY